MKEIMLKEQIWGEDTAVHTKR